MERFAGDSGLVHGGPALEHGAVHGDSLSGPDQNFISRRETVWIDTFLGAIAPSHRLPCAERADSVNGGPSAERAAFFEKATQFKEERDQRGGHEVTGRSRSEHGDGDQLVRGPARVSGHHSAKTRHSVGIPTTAAAKAAAKLSDLPLIGLEAHQQRSQAEKPDPNESGAEPRADAAALFWSKSARHRSRQPDSSRWSATSFIGRRPLPARDRTSSCRCRIGARRGSREACTNVMRNP